jgi:DNA polymerase epsilon subunit 2
VPAGINVIDVKELDLLLRSASNTAVQGAPQRQQLDDALTFSVMDAFSMIKWNYLPTRRTFEKVNPGSMLLHSTAAHKTDLFRQRYNLVLQRLMRHPVFQTTSLLGNSAKSQQLTSIESLPGSNGMKCVLGMLSQIEEGKYFLEDLDSSIQVDLTELVGQPPQGLFTENSIVVCNGYMAPGSDVYRVTRMALPHAESRAQTLRAFPNIDFLGDGVDTEPSLRSRTQLAENLLREQDINHFFLIFSDVWLDDPSVLLNIQSALIGTRQMITQRSKLLGVIFMGNFVSPRFRGDLDTYNQSFAKFGELLAPRSGPGLLPAGCQILFVPGPTDPSPSPDCLPRPRLSTALQEALFSASTLQHDKVKFSSSPCRIRYLSKEIVLFREDVSSRMRRHSVVNATSHDAESFVGLLIRTLLDQGHLFPLPLPLQPTFWDFDHALHLYPLPDTLVLCESFAKYSFVHEGCNVFNAGSFSTDGSFAFFYPSKNETEIVQVNIGD